MSVLGEYFITSWRTRRPYNNESDDDWTLRKLQVGI